MPRHPSIRQSINPLIRVAAPAHPLPPEPFSPSLHHSITPSLHSVRHFVPLSENYKACREHNRLRLSCLQSKNPKNIKISNLSPNPPETPRNTPEPPGTRLFLNSRTYPSDGTFYLTLSCFIPNPTIAAHSAAVPEPPPMAPPFPGADQPLSPLKMSKTLILGPRKSMEVHPSPRNPCRKQPHRRCLLRTPHSAALFPTFNVQCSMFDVRCSRPSSYKSVHPIPRLRKSAHEVHIRASTA